jgi:hypothetical protein
MELMIGALLNELVEQQQRRHLVLLNATTDLGSRKPLG